MENDEILEQNEVNMEESIVPDVPWDMDVCIAFIRFLLYLKGEKNEKRQKSSHATD